MKIYLSSIILLVFSVGCVSTSSKRNPAATDPAKLNSFMDALWTHQDVNQLVKIPYAIKDQHIAMRVTSIEDFMKYYDMESVYLSPSANGGPSIFIPVPSSATPLGFFPNNYKDHEDERPSDDIKVDSLGYYFKGGYFKTTEPGQKPMSDAKANAFIKKTFEERPFGNKYSGNLIAAVNKAMKWTCVKDSSLRPVLDSNGVDTGNKVGRSSWDLSLLNMEAVATAKSLPKRTKRQKKARALQILRALTGGFRFYGPLGENKSVFQTACFKPSKPKESNNSTVKVLNDYMFPTRGESRGGQFRVWLLWKEAKDSNHHKMIRKRSLSQDELADIYSQYGKADRLVLKGPTGWYFFNRTVSQDGEDGGNSIKGMRDVINLLRSLGYDYYREKDDGTLVKVRRKLRGDGLL